MTEQQKDRWIQDLTRVLQAYVDEDETNEGGHWEESNAYWLCIKREAQALLAEIKQANNTGP